MYTIEAFQLAFSSLVENVKKVKLYHNENYDDSFEIVKQRVLKTLKLLREKDPIMMPITFNDEGVWGQEEITSLINNIADRSKERKELGLVFSGANTSVSVRRCSLVFPKYINFWDKPHVLLWPYNEESWEGFAIQLMNQIVMGCLLALPKGKVRVNIINPSMSNKANWITSNLPSDLWRVFIDNREIIEFLESLSNRIKDRIKNNPNTIYNNPMYEIVLLLDYPYMFDQTTDHMRTIIEQGQQAGIHFIILNDLRKSFIDSKSFDILSLKKDYFQEPGAFNNVNKGDYDTSLFRTYQLFEQPHLLEACIKYLKSNSDDETIENESYNSNYAVVRNGINVPIGKPVNSKIIDFNLGPDGHVHSFIIGATGTGKSVLLHNIIIKAITKYAPEDLQLYLLDCKLGGVEFNRYKGVKHIRALLADNSDIQVILEILRDLSEQMKERGKTLRNAGVQKIDEYNNTYPESRMSRIWVVIDECHVLFEQHSSNDRRTRTEIIDIITKVATEGRSQGVHLIMATQTLANADIPNAILNNITDRYILNCAPVDAEKMWTNSSRLVSKLGKGDVYFHNTSNVFPDTQFHAFYHTSEESNKLIEKAIEKATDRKGNGQFYFDGAQIFNFDQQSLESIVNVRKGNLKASPGKSVSLKQVPVTITLKQDMGENILITGIDDQGQSIRTAMDILCSLVISNIKAEQNYKIYVFDYKDDDEGDYQDVLENLENSNLITMVRKREAGAIFKKLADDINSNTAESSILFILGQQRFRGLKLDSEIEGSNEASNSFFGNNGFVTSTGTEIRTYKQALSHILDNGPESHVHTVLQVDKPANLLFEDYVTSKFVFKKFRHLIILKSDDKAALTFGLPDEIRLETLNSEPERLRAIYYADGDDGWTLFSPFAMPNKTELSNLTNKQ